MKNMVLMIVFLSALVASTSHASSSNANDFCVADLKGPDSPSGYHCKPRKTVTTKDFVSSFRDSQTAFVNDLPGLNGLGISVARITLAPHGSIPMHTHPGASEILIVVDGIITAGFITTEEAYVKELNAGDVMVFPQGQLHFVANTANMNATIMAAFSSANPTFQFLPKQLYSNNVPSELIAQTAAIDVPQVKKQKARYGGSG